MYATVLTMLSSTSLSAFSVASGVDQAQRSGAVQPVRNLPGLAGNSQPGNASSSQASPSGQPNQPFTLPNLTPGQILPRGSLLNLSV
jgi:hypothetical protein|uniref:Uncharacterized protein n=1 Tax=Acidicaldus sp. TaxID=1872105 RepID=A0A8J4HBC8_9PROT